MNHTERRERRNFRIAQILSYGHKIIDNPELLKQPHGAIPPALRPKKLERKRGQQLLLPL